MANVLTNAGCQYIVRALSGNETITPDYLSWGTGPDTADVTDTDVSVQSTEPRALCARSIPAPDTAAWTANLVADRPKTITNAGIYTDPAAGSLLLLADFPGVVLPTGAAIQFVFTLRIMQ